MNFREFVEILWTTFRGPTAGFSSVQSASLNRGLKLFIPTARFALLDSATYGINAVAIFESALSVPPEFTAVTT